MAEELSTRFAALVQRELGADGVRLLEADERPDDGSITAALPDGRRVEASFRKMPDDAAAIARRLEILVSAFEVLVTDGAPSKRREPPAVSLKKELGALVRRCRGVDAAVIDANSPVVWACARDESEDDETGKHALELRGDAIARLRAMPQVATLHKGGHVAHSVREEAFGLLARSFAGIYILVVAFDQAFDEIRAERAVRDALPKIERLVLALPPLDPEPVPAGVVALRPRRRRLRTRG